MFGKWYGLVFVVLGHICSVLGLIALLVPLVPSTPFFILACSCYAKGSEKFHRMILNNRYCGPAIKNWQKDKSLSRRAKIMALVVLLINVFWGMIILELVTLKIILVIVVLAVTIYVLSRPSPKPND